MTKASLNQYPYVTFAESASPGTPASGLGYIYASTGGTPYYVNDGGTETSLLGGGSGDVATDAIWDAVGDLVQGTGANTAARLATGNDGQVLTAANTGTAVGWEYPPGYEYTYAQGTANVSITATSEATANTVVTAGAVTFDGSTTAIIEVYAPFIAPPAGNINMILCIYDGAGSVGRIAQMTNSDAANVGRVPFLGRWRLTPSAASHTYSLRAYVDSGTGTVNGGPGGSSGSYMPHFIRVLKA